MFDELGDHLKALERGGQTYVYGPDYVYIRVDGRTFSKLTKGLEKPCDIALQDTMIHVAKKLVKELHAVVGYVQSDEISVLLPRLTEPNQGRIFGGRKDKLLSISASLATAAFHSYASREYFISLSRMIEGCAHFDSRVVDCLSAETAASFFWWRTLDARRNAVSMYAQSRYSHAQLQGVSTRGMRDMFETDGYTQDFLDVGGSFRNGTFIVPTLVEVPPSELTDIPEQYRPTTPVTRRAFIELNDVTTREQVAALIPGATS